jgi:hypothetical protein
MARSTRSRSVRRGARAAALTFVVGAPDARVLDFLLALQLCQVAVDLRAERSS